MKNHPLFLGTKTVNEEREEENEEETTLSTTFINNQMMKLNEDKDQTKKIPENIATEEINFEETEPTEEEILKTYETKSKF